MLDTATDASKVFLYLRRNDPDRCIRRAIHSTRVLFHNHHVKKIAHDWQFRKG